MLWVRKYSWERLSQRLLSSQLSSTSSLGAKTARDTLPEHTAFWEKSGRGSLGLNTNTEDGEKTGSNPNYFSATSGYARAELRPTVHINVGLRNGCLKAEPISDRMARAQTAALTVCVCIPAAEGSHVLREGVSQQQSDVHGGAPLHCGRGRKESITPAPPPGLKHAAAAGGGSQEQVRRFQQHSSSPLVEPTRYLEQLERPKHRFLGGGGGRKQGPLVSNMRLLTIGEFQHRSALEGVSQESRSDPTWFWFLF